MMPWVMLGSGSVQPAVRTSAPRSSFREKPKSEYEVSNAVSVDSGSVSVWRAATVAGSSTGFSSITAISLVSAVSAGWPADDSADSRTMACVSTVLAVDAGTET